MLYWSSIYIAAGEGYRDIAVQDEPIPQVQFASGETLYVEGLLEGRWAGRYWTADGRLPWPFDLRAEDAFLIEVKTEPTAMGEVLSKGWKFKSAEELPATERGADHFVVELSRESPSLGVKVHTLVDGTPVLVRWLEIENASDKPVALTRVQPWTTRIYAHTYARNYLSADDAAPFALGYFTKDEWGWEGWFDWKALPAGRTEVECDKGQGFDDPFFILQNRATGEYFIGHLAWSANWKMEFEYKKVRDPGLDSLRFGVGPAADSTLRVIAPGETIVTPQMHLGMVAGDLDSAVQTMHDHLRDTVLPTRKPERSHLIQYLVPADQGYPRESEKGFTEEVAFRNIDLAAAIGAELFTLDAGWWDVPLDWQPSTQRFPNGLKPIVDYVHEKGMLFGLYSEIEGGRGSIEESKVYQEHPEWFGAKNVVKLSIPEAAEWVESEAIRLIEEYDLDLFRLDYNPVYTYEGPETPRDGFMENNYWRYYEAFYGIFERIHKKYPDLILQQCSAGGARNDLGAASRFHEDYLTDGLWIPNVLRSYCGQTLGLPPESFVIAFGAYGQPTTGRPGNLDTHLRSTFSLSTPLFFAGMVGPDVERMAPERLEKHRRYAGIYKEFIRPLLPACRMYHHAPVSSRGGVDSSGWFAVEFAAPDRSKGWATVVRIGESDTDTCLFKPSGLDMGKTYRVRFDAADASLTLSGLEMVRDGLPVRLKSLASSELLLFEAE